MIPHGAAKVEGDLSPPKIRTTAARCHKCNAMLECPPETVVWVWAKSPAVLAFLKEHDHGDPRLTGIEIAQQDDDDESE